MTLPLFLNVEQILSIYMGELPDGVYATDRADNPDFNKRSYSSSELRAQSQMLANLYLNLQGIYENKFISTIQQDGVANWERELFQDAQDSSLSFDQRKSNLLAKKRASGSISLPSIQQVVSGILTPLGLPFAILPYCGQNNGVTPGAWILDMSPLDLGTFLALEDPLLGAGRGMGITPLDCNLDFAAAGITSQDLANIQATAYTYEVQIYGIASASTLSLLDRLLTQVEPARSTHIITNNAVPPVNPNILDLGQFSADTLLDAIDCGTLDMPPATYDVLDFGGF